MQIQSLLVNLLKFSTQRSDFTDQEYVKKFSIATQIEQSGSNVAHSDVAVNLIVVVCYPRVGEGGGGG